MRRCNCNGKPLLGSRCHRGEEDVRCFGFRVEAMSVSVLGPKMHLDPHPQFMLAGLARRAAGMNVGIMILHRFFAPGCFDFLLVRLCDRARNAASRERDIRDFRPTSAGTAMSRR
jgi:hypothetical protein